MDFASNAHTQDESVGELLGSARRAYPSQRPWKQAYRRKVLASDAAVIVFAVALAQMLRFGIDGIAAQQDPDFAAVTTYSAVLSLLWILCLSLVGSRDVGLIGNGADEYRRVVAGTGWVFGTIAVGTLLLQAGMARGYLGIALPVGLIGLIAERHIWRRLLAKARARGEFTSEVIVVGCLESVASIGKRLDRATDAGYRVIGACVPGFSGGVGETVQAGTRSIPILGDENSIDAALTLTSASTVAVAAVEQLGYERMRNLAWKLDALDVDLVVAPGVADVAGPRLKIRPIDNLAMLQVDRAKCEGASMIGKSIFDFVFAVVVLLVVLPVVALAAIAIKAEDGGPVFFRQERVGLGGKTFRIWKLRTMVTDADKMIDEAKTKAGQDAAVFYKSANDARITRIGHFLRKTSIDEIPQLFNVLGRDMSLVGPRPLVPGEGSHVFNFIERRTLVKPGITGLWQVSGRSSVSEEERIRLDHYYVDNWSVVQDLVIIWRTIAAVVKSDGAC
ncbi:sugar transferase [Antrihabitans stalactiti]|uniref:Sugar transferase n=1 Tax=Antrihabitans stalactiti TaxID=2584121 RepID=A0A848KLB0_9NOCA|nr:sugar transferase [Antrihabitans stalactiti]NMN97774.1 sugar transferase [Antrihabitans stalactiti]